MDEVVREFLVESSELLDELDSDFVTLEHEPNDAELLAKIFRCLHTIKGSTGFLGFPRLERLTHVGENLLSRMRDGDIDVDMEVIRAIYELAERIRSALSLIENSGGDDDLDIDTLVATLERLKVEKVKGATPTPAPEKALTPVLVVAVEAASAAPAPKAPEAAPPLASPTAAPTSTTTAEAESRDAASQPSPEVSSQAGKDPKQGDRRSIGDILVSKGLVKPEHLVLAARAQRAGDPRRIGEILVEKGHVKPEEIRAALEQQGEDQGHTISEGSIRVDVALLDKLMNLVGELVLARNQIQQHTQASEVQELVRASARLNLITTELQEGVMKTRMQPVRNVWSKFPRLVRHLGVVCDKKVRIEMEGQDTELDKTIIEALKDPLTHFVRNTVDHGIEPPEQRLVAGKPEEGVVSLRAFHEGGQVNMEISDDGRGINVERVRQRAVERGIINAVQAANMSEREIANLVFEPGFSTAEKVTNVSGRGVGMDVVRTNIERVGGTCDLISQAGVGTTLKVKIPLTLAIIPALLVRSGEGHYALPQVSLLELVRLDAAVASRVIDDVGGAPVFRLRDKLLPLVDLNRELQVPSRPHEETNIVVLQADDRTFGLVVDEVRDTAEIVVKPLGKALKTIDAFAGATILGDGSVALILDVLGLAQRARIIEEVRDRSGSDAVAVAAVEEDDEPARLMLFRLGRTRRYAVPLDLVDRLEEIATDRVEWSCGHEVVQYRGSILPIVRLSSALGLGHDAGRGGLDEDGPDEQLTVLVVGILGRRVGLVVDEILDIVESDDLSLLETDVAGIAGSIVLDGRVTDVVDLPAVLARTELWDATGASRAVV